MPYEPASERQQSAAQASRSSDGESIGCIAPLALLFVALFNDAESNGASGMPAFLAALILAIIVHELGHLIAGWFVGFQFLAITGLRGTAISERPQVWVALALGAEKIGQCKNGWEPSRAAAQ